MKPGGWRMSTISPISECIEKNTILKAPLVEQASQPHRRSTLPREYLSPFIH